MQPQINQKAPNGSKGYGKRPLWQWVLIYVVLAIVVYGVAYAGYRHFHKSSTDSSSTSSGGLY